jgi:integrase
MEQGNVDPSVRRKIRAVASSMCETAIIHGIAEDNPFLGFRIKGKTGGRRRVLTTAEYVSILKYLPEPWATRVELIAMTGMRGEEAMALERNDIQRTKIPIYRTLNDLGPDGFHLKLETKTGTERTADVTQEMSIRLLMMEPVPAGALPSSPEWRGIFPPIHHTTFCNGPWHSAVKASAIDWLPAPRDMRHAFAHWSREGGADLDFIMEALGHASLAMTDRYLGKRQNGSGRALEAVQAHRAKGETA